jgi:hypothetical protein
VDHKPSKSVVEDWFNSLPKKRVSVERLVTAQGVPVLKENMYSIEDGLCLPSAAARLNPSALEVNQEKRKREEFSHQVAAIYLSSILLISS